MSDDVLLIANDAGIQLQLLWESDGLGASVLPSHVTVDPIRVAGCIHIVRVLAYAEQVTSLLSSPVGFRYSHGVRSAGSEFLVRHPARSAL